MHLDPSNALDSQRNPNYYTIYALKTIKISEASVRTFHVVQSIEGSEDMQDEDLAPILRTSLDSSGIGFSLVI